MGWNVGNQLIVEKENIGSRAIDGSNTRKRWLLVLLISLTLTLPCFWHRRLEAGDLGSHIYNAWLAQLIQQGKAPGLTIVTQWNNVVFDFMLTGLGHVFNLFVAARIASTVAVLIFFWGAFSFISAVTGWEPWLMAPLLAMISYGWTFNAGLFNYYISVGLSFLLIAIVYRGWSRYWFAAVLVLPLIYLAHPVGLCWALAAGVYIAIANRIPRRMQVLLFAGALCLLVAAHFSLRMHAVTKPPSHSALFYNGLDQIFFTNRYGILVALLWCLTLAASLRELFRGDWVRLLNSALIPVQLYLLIEAGIQLLPESVLLTHSAAQFSEISERLSSLSAVLLCCLLACVRPPRWLLSAVAALTVVFFLFLYQDTGVIDRMESQAEILVRRIPAGQRLISSVDPPLKYRLSVRHILDLACLDYCFDYGNYEPATQQFRVRGLPGNEFVVDKPSDSLAIDAGTYVVPANALPLSQLYQCGPPWTKICIRSLGPEESLRQPADQGR